MLTSAELERLAATHHTLLKQEPATTVELLGSGEDAVVRKTYRNLGHRWLQSFGRRSRAGREFHNLTAVVRTGVPCTTPLLWSERRRWGCVDESTLVTRYLPDSRPLKRVLAELPRHTATRARLATAMGRLVADLHRGGFLWCTPMPRNVLVLGKPEDARLAVCDTPAGIQLGRSLHQSRLARIDLFDAAFSPSRQVDFSATERRRWLRGYCDDNRPAVRRLWRALAHRSVLRHDVGRALAMFWHTYILLPLQPNRRHQPDPAR
ncbi:MAG: lipopolysaccharide kinase InaA family protein [Planctomycetota bacterium]